MKVDKNKDGRDDRVEKADEISDKLLTKAIKSKYTFLWIAGIFLAGYLTASALHPILWPCPSEAYHLHVPDHVAPDQ